MLPHRAAAPRGADAAMPTARLYALVGGSVATLRALPHAGTYLLNIYYLLILRPITVLSPRANTDLLHYLPKM